MIHLYHISTFGWGNGNSHDSHDVRILLRSPYIHLLQKPLPGGTACFPEPMWGRAKAWMGPQLFQGKPSNHVSSRDGQKLGISWYYASFGFNGNTQLNFFSFYLKAMMAISIDLNVKYGCKLLNMTCRILMRMESRAFIIFLGVITFQLRRFLRSQPWR